jgi:hypothetical protein
MAVSSSDVERHLGATDLSSSEIDAFVEAAGRYYDNLTSGQSVSTAVRDDVVERIAAHMIATGPERQISSAGEGGGSVSFEGETGQGLRATTHGQMAITLDPTGELATTDKPGASISVPDAKGTHD